jgi:nucleotide-binding universal stress UspA family protein
MTHLVGYSPRTADNGAVELACQLARSESESVHAITVVPRGWETVAGSATDGDFVTWATEEGEDCARAALVELAKHPDVASSAAWVSGRSVPAEILKQAQLLDATMIVVGSGDEGPVGEVTLTTKANRLLHSSQLPVAIAPRDYLAGPNARVSRITLAFRDDDATWKLLDQVAEICTRVGAELRLLTVALRNRAMVTSPVRRNEELVFERLLREVDAAQAEAVEHLAGKGVTATTWVAKGQSWREALGGVEFAPGDVLVVGSSSTIGLSSVFLGSSAAKIVRNSPVPVVVVP